MKFTYPRLILGLVVSALAAFPAVAAPLRVLYFTKSAGYEHSAIKQVDGQPSYSANVLAALGAKHGLVFTCSKAGSLFSPQYLAQFDVVFFYTTGDLCTVGTDGQPAMTAAGKQALLDYVQGGGGFVGVHSSSDTFHTNEHGGGNNPIRGQRYTNYGDACDSYVKLLGGEFIRQYIFTNICRNHSACYSCKRHQLTAARRCRCQNNITLIIFAHHQPSALLQRHSCAVPRVQ